MSEVDASVPAEVEAPVPSPKKEKQPKREGKAKGKGKSKEGGKGKQREYNGPTGSGGYRLNVKNLSNETTTKEQLEALFAPFGTVSAADVKMREDGASRGFGYVILANEEEGAKAIAAMNGKTIGGKALSVGPAERRPVEDGGKGVGKGKGQDPMADMMAQQQQVMMYYMMQQQQQQQAMMAMMGMPGMGVMPPPMPPGMGMAGLPGLGLGMDAAAVGGGEYTGTIKSVNTSNGYGFITCPETHAIYSRDVFIHKDLLLPGAKAGDRLKFTIGFNEKGQPQAQSAVPA